MRLEIVNPPRGLGVWTRDGGPLLPPFTSLLGSSWPSGCDHLPLGHAKKLDGKREEWMSPAALTSLKHLATSPGSHRSTAIRGTSFLGNKGAERPLAQSVDV